MDLTIDLVLLGKSDNRPNWSLGQIYQVDATPSAVHALIEQRLSNSLAEAWLFWDSSFGAPDAALVHKALALPGDVWHAGLCLGMSGLPKVVDFVHPTWMLNRDPDVAIDSVSWRFSLRACLVRTEIIRQLGGLRPEFQSLAGAALEMGYRYIVRGAIARHISWLVPDEADALPVEIPFEDDLRFAYYCFGYWWTLWAIARSTLTGYSSLEVAFRLWVKVVQERRQIGLNAYERQIPLTTNSIHQVRVSVLIATLFRYGYLRKVLEQLRVQTIKPFEIIIVDQTDLDNREVNLVGEFYDLPISFIYLDQPGQCSSRNIGAQRAQGEYILFIDDDIDEIPQTFIEDHLNVIYRFPVQVSSGVVQEVNALPLPRDFKYLRISNVFPTNNSLVARSALENTGLFDLAFEGKQNEDHDLGMRLYLSGALMILDPKISVLHHHASIGGLRVHRARVVTYSSSRQFIFQRHLPNVSEIYLALRYFTRHQVREMLWIRTFATFSIRGNIYRKLLKSVIGLILLPHTLWITRKRWQQACSMLYEYPQIPSLISIDNNEV